MVNESFSCMMVSNVRRKESHPSLSNLECVCPFRNAACAGPAKIAHRVDVTAVNEVTAREPDFLIVHTVCSRPLRKGLEASLAM